MRFAVLAAALVLLVPLPSLAQSGAAPAPVLGLPRGEVGLPLPNIGQPLPTIGAPPPPQFERHMRHVPLPSSAVNPVFNSPVNPVFNLPLNPVFRSQVSPVIHPPVIYPDAVGTLKRGYGYQSHRSGYGSVIGRRRNLGTTIVAPVVSYPVVVYMTPAIDPIVVAPPEPIVEPRSAKGTLILQVEPQTTQIYVDGYYVGAVDDFPRGLPLEAGPHKIELTDYGYESVRFDVRISAYESVTYRRVLASLKPQAEVAPAAPAPAPAAAKPTPMYYIPGCYVGNVAPKEAALPAGCDPARAVRLN